MQPVSNRRVWGIGVGVTMCWTATLGLGQQATPSPAQVEGARAYLARLAAMPDTPGTGAFPAVKQEIATFPDHVDYRPADLGKLGSTKLGLYLFGNPGCSNDGASYRLHLLEIASHGYLAIALGRIRTGPGATARPGGPTTDANGLTAALDWALKQNTDPASPFHSRIDPEAVAVSGSSCGGLQALQVAADPRIKTLVIMNSGLYNEGPNFNPGKYLPKTMLNDIHSPTFYILGGETDRAYKNGMDDFARINHVPVVVGNVLGVGHGGTYWEPNGGKAAAAVVAWLNWQLRGATGAAKMFVGEACGVCVDAVWKIGKIVVECRAFVDASLRADRRQRCPGVSSRRQPIGERRRYAPGYTRNSHSPNADNNWGTK